MLKLLIADESEPFAEALTAELRAEFDIRNCQDGETALEMLFSFRPDVLILNLMLPYKDGLTVLQQSAHRPRVMIAITPYLSDYIQQRAADLGVQYIMRTPAVSALRIRLMDMLASAEPKADLSAQAAVHLHILNFHTHLDGYRQLCVGVPIFAKNPGMLLSKELYPAIAARLDATDPRTVEHSIRKSIADAWNRRDLVAWEKYFPGSHTPLTNKEFISRLAEMLEL
ncbi:MAG: response regulator [Oscillospiraceae bacterium]|nr:response regulator [Oscillospiraceae bacterium]